LAGLRRGAQVIPGRGSSERSFQFGDWRVEPSRGLLTAVLGREVRIEPQLMDLLVLFATSDGRVLAKDEIIASVWSGRAVGDDTLAAAISRLRAALGATPARRYIETVPKRGYRLATPLDGPDATPSKAVAPPEDSEATRLVAQGLAMLRTGAPMALPQARLYFEAAIGADPTLAEAQAGLAETLFAQHLMGQDARPALLRSAQAAAAAAVGLDDQLARGWTALGYAALMADRDFAAADRAFLRAIALDETAASAHRYRAIALGSIGRLVEAEREGRKAVELEPLSLAGRNLLLQILLAGRRYPQAITEAKAMATLSAEASEAWYARGWAHVLMGEREAGVDALLHGLKLWGVAKAEIAALRDLHVAEGFAGLCRAVADFFETQSVMFSARPTDIAVLRTLAGQTDLAFAALETAIARDDVYLLFLDVLPWFDELNNDPRWRPLVERARLVR
jgi:DNA-binding winged helix-turn-helix (wHTH) protein